MKKKFHVFIPIHEYWVYEVMAESKEQAIEFVEDADNQDKQQVYSISCPKNAKIEVEER